MLSQQMVNWWFGILGVPRIKIPFLKGIPGIQTTNPNHNLPLVGNVPWKKKTYTFSAGILPFVGIPIPKKKFQFPSFSR